MNTNPENESILGMLRQILSLNTSGSSPMVRKEKIVNPEKKKKLRNAEVVVAALEKIHKGRRSHDIFRDKIPDVATLAKHEDLVRFISRVLLIDDPQKYHDPVWLKEAFNELDNILTRNPTLSECSDRGVYDAWLFNLDIMRTKAENYRKSADYRRDEKMEKNLSPEAIEAERRMEEVKGGRKRSERSSPVGDEAKPLSDLITGLPDVLQPEEMEKLRRAARSVASGEFKTRDENIIGTMERGFRDARAEIVKKISKTEGSSEQIKKEHKKALDELEILTNTREKMARQVMEKTGSEPGRLWDIINRSDTGSEIQELIKSDADYRDYWFYKIISPILYNQRGEGHQALYTLYVAGDMDLFMEIVRSIQDKEGRFDKGRQLAQRYEVLKNSIFQSHDMDYYCAHPQQDMKEFIGATGFFLNKYIDAGHQDPLTAMGKRCYEAALLNIRDTNKGYIPRGDLEWTQATLTPSRLDEMARQYLIEAIKNGQLYEIKTDDVTREEFPAPSAWNRQQVDLTRPITWRELYGYESMHSREYSRELGDLKIAAALKVAKGLALVDQRLLEIIAYSKGTGTEYDQAGEPGEGFSLAAKQFNSLPYENIAKHIAPMIHYYSRYRLGGEYYDAFFNMLVLDRWKNWKPEIMRKIVEFHVLGDHEGAIKYLETECGMDGKEAADALKTRLVESENPFEFSGMWGPWTSWRIGDASISFDDWERERTYGTNIKLITASNFSARQAKRHFELHSQEYKDLRKEFRDRMIENDKAEWRLAALQDVDRQKVDPNDVDGAFELLWRNQKLNLPALNSKKKYWELIDDLWSKNKEPYRERAEKLRKAYIARTWVQATMRSPLLVSRYIKTEWEHAGTKITTPLRNKIIWDLLHIDADEAGQMRTKLTKENDQFEEIARLEAAIMSVSQVAIRENRDLKNSDFDDLIKLAEADKSIPEDEQKRRIFDLKNAKKFWVEVKKEMLGGEYETGAGSIYDKLGIKDAPENRERGARMHNIDWNQVDSIVEVTKEETKDGKVKIKESKLKFELFPSWKDSHITQNLLNRNYKTTLFSTEDMGWEYLNMEALGERNPVRRAGDLASHVQFAQLFEEYVNNLLVARPKIEDLVDKQKEMWTAMSGDFVDIAHRACYRIAYTTSMMYRASDEAWAIPFYSPVYGIFHDSSIMQMIRGKDRADAWGPNEMLHYNQAVGGKQIIPKRTVHGLAGYSHLETLGFDDFRLGPTYQGYTTVALARANGGTKANSVIEIVNMTLLITTILNIWRSLRAKNEEDEGK